MRSGIFYDLSPAKNLCKSGMKKQIVIRMSEIPIKAINKDVVNGRTGLTGPNQRND